MTPCRLPSEYSSWRTSRPPACARATEAFTQAPTVGRALHWFRCADPLAPGARVGLSTRRQHRARLELYQWGSGRLRPDPESCSLVPLPEDVVHVNVGSAVAIPFAADFYNIAIIWSARPSSPVWPFPARPARGDLGPRSRIPDQPQSLRRQWPWYRVRLSPRSQLRSETSPPRY